MMRLPALMTAVIVLGMALIGTTGATFTDTTTSGDNSLTAVSCFSCDIEVTAIAAPATVALSAIFPIDVDVTVRNNGTGTAPITLSLTDSDGPVGSHGVTLAPGETRVVTFDWTPTNLVIRTITITAEAVSTLVDPNPANNTRQRDVLLVLF